MVSVCKCAMNCLIKSMVFKVHSEGTVGPQWGQAKAPGFSSDSEGAPTFSFALDAGLSWGAQSAMSNWVRKSLEWVIRKLSCNWYSVVFRKVSGSCNMYDRVQWKRLFQSLTCGIGGRVCIVKEGPVWTSVQEVLAETHPGLFQLLLCLPPGWLIPIIWTSQFSFGEEQGRPLQSPVFIFREPDTKLFVSFPWLWVRTFYDLEPWRGNKWKDYLGD